MKISILYLLTVTGLFTGCGCSSKPDSNKTAEETNDSLVEQATPVQAERLAADSKSNAKDVAEFMIALADAGQMIPALSELAVERATDPAVKAFARQAIDQQRTREIALTDAAQTFTIVLPKTLSTDSQTRLGKLRDEKTGPNFDRAYLRDVVFVNDQATGKTKSLTKNADSPAVKNLALTISADSEKQMKEAEGLMKGMINDE